MGCHTTSFSCSKLIFYVNGKKICEDNPDPSTTLLQYLRDKLCLRGTKLGCAEGGCGACTVMISRYNHASGQLRHLAVNACLVPLCSLHGVAVTTVEGIGSTRTRLHDVQKRLAESHGSQCGFCTPGFVMSMYALIRTNPKPSAIDMETAFQGNLCRCTGYRPILEGFKSFITNANGCPMGDSCCQRQKTNMNVNGCPMGDSCCQRQKTVMNGGTHETLTNGYSYAPADSTQEPLFRSELQNVNGCPMGDSCCQRQKTVMNGAYETLTNGYSYVPAVSAHEPPFRSGLQKGRDETVLNGCRYVPADSSQEPLFPAELQLRSEEYNKGMLIFHSDTMTWYRPTTLTDLLLLKHRHPTARLVVGNTEIGVEMKLKNVVYPVIIAATHITELNRIEQTETGIRFGASVSLTTVNETLKNACNQLPETKKRVFAAFVEMFHLFAGVQIRNTAAIGGNIITASPISDLNPLLLAAGCTLTLASSSDGQRTVKMDEKFFVGYRQTLLKSDEVLLYIDIPFSSPDEYFAGYKQSPRVDDDIATVNAGMRVLFEEGQTTIKDIKLCFGGMAPTTVMATKTAKQLISRSWDEDLVPLGFKLLLDEIQLEGGSPGGMEAYRCSLVASFFFKFYLTVRMKLQEKLPHLFETVVPETYQSATTPYHRPPSSGVQLFEQVGEEQLKVDAVGRPVPHLSAQKHTTGEAVYTDDMPTFTNELYLALVVSTKAHARLVNVDPSDALRMPGVVDYVSHRDVPGSNMFGACVQDEEIFASDTVTCQGHVIGAVLARTKQEAQKAAKVVKVTYEEMDPIITIEEAIAAGSFFPSVFPYMHPICKGDVTSALAASDHVLEGSLHVGGQEHFYLEPQCAIAVPKAEDGEMEIYISSQSPSSIQAGVATALGVDFSKVICHVKRIGGGFGGKETRPILLALPCATAAYKHNVPVRCVLDRDEDMAITGTRHPFLAKYKVGFRSDGKVLALKLELYSNAGNTLDVSAWVMQRALAHCDNCYSIPNFHVTGHICKTNLPSSTAFRGFGCPQVNIIMENIVDEVAAAVGLSTVEIRHINLYKEGDFTHYNQRLEDVTLEKCWQELLKQSDYEQRKLAVDTFSRRNRWKKRGLSMAPVKMGIGMGTGFLNQAGALVHIYTDGSVLLSHGGVEMGQGLHTKMIQVASRVLKIPVSYIHLSDTSTNIVPNASSTVASVSSDINGMAVVNACQTLMNRLDPYIKADPDGSWKDWVKKAWIDQVSLSATGFYSFPRMTYDPKTNTGSKYLYFTYGVACSEVEIDCLTGAHTILQTDIVMDVGKSLNPAIDIGQIEGGFVQGCGLFTIEQQKYTPRGYLLTRGPGTYKIPSCASIPIKFNVTLLKESSNPKAVYSSKGIGEPSLGLATTVFLAIKDAIRSARQDAGLTGRFQLDSPATAERIRMACVDDITQQVPAYESRTFEPWFVCV